MMPRMVKELYVRQLALGPMKNFVYLAGAKGAKEVCVIDPAWDVAAILSAAEEDGKTVVSAFLSHHHGDHINGVHELLKQRDVPVYVQRVEAQGSEVIRAFGESVKPIGPGERIDVGPMSVTCILTPGHTAGSQCLLCEDALVSGDTVFVNACGRCDFTGGSPEQMFDSLHRVLGALPSTTALYPGHDYGDVKVSSLERERRTNPYFQLHELRAFVDYRTRPRT